VVVGDDLTSDAAGESNGETAIVRYAPPVDLSAPKADTGLSAKDITS
jgi:hypothetical protein